MSVERPTSGGWLDQSNEASSIGRWHQALRQPVGTTAFTSPESEQQIEPQRVVPKGPKPEALVPIGTLGDLGVHEQGPATNLARGGASAFGGIGDQRATKPMPLVTTINTEAGKQHRRNLPRGVPIQSSTRVAAIHRYRRKSVKPSQCPVVKDTPSDGVPGGERPGGLRA